MFATVQVGVSVPREGRALALVGIQLAPSWISPHTGGATFGPVVQVHLDTHGTWMAGGGFHLGYARTYGEDDCAGYYPLPQVEALALVEIQSRGNVGWLVGGQLVTLPLDRPFVVDVALVEVGPIRGEVEPAERYSVGAGVPFVATCIIEESR
ncbi:MAG: hypothetical protein ABMA64_31760 [Myxococcota bacterium]